MSPIRHLFPALLVAVALTITVQPVQAQYFQPFDDLCKLDLDYQWFKPLYCDCPDERLPNTGIFFTYDRMYANVSRPTSGTGVTGEFQTFTDVTGIQLTTLNTTPTGVSDGTGGDWTWGNRFNFGYMTEADHGWLFTYWGVRNSGRTINTDHINRNGVVEPDLIQDPTGTLFDTINDVDLQSFEINKTWRLATLHSGAVIEPLFGFRYVRIRDRFRRDSVVSVLSSFIERFGEPDADTGISSLTQTDDTVDEYIIQNNDLNRNHLLGGQLGARIHTRRGRWILSSTIVGYAFHNFQQLERSSHTEGSFEVTRTDFDDDGSITSETVIREGVIVEFDGTSTQDRGRFVWGGELRLEAALELTESIALRGGVELMEYANGVGRGPGGGGDNSLTMAGLTFGFTMNR